MWSRKFRPATKILLLLTVCVISPYAALAGTISESPARLLADGRADEAIRQLQALVLQKPADSSAHQLTCRVFYAEALADPAITACEKAVGLAPASSDNQMWLGRAYGLKAEEVSPFAALPLARKVRGAFERAAQLDPNNVPAQTALGQFYIAAPALIGGGLDKAERVAGQLMSVSPAAGHRLLAMAAEKRKDPIKAETEFHAAVSAGHTAAAWVDLGAFYQRQQQPEKAVATLQAALDADHVHDAALMDIASILGDAHRSPELAERALRLYLDSAAKSEAAPAFKAHVQLGQLLAQRGDREGARHEYTAALELASSYSPARKALQRLR